MSEEDCGENVRRDARQCGKGSFPTFTSVVDWVDSCNQEGETNRMEYTHRGGREAGEATDIWHFTCSESVQRISEQIHCTYLEAKTIVRVSKDVTYYAAVCVSRTPKSNSSSHGLPAVVLRLTVTRIRADRSARVFIVNAKVGSD